MDFHQWPSSLPLSRVALKSASLSSTGIIQLFPDYGPVRHPASPACPSWDVGLVCALPTGLPMLPCLPTSMHNGTNTPAEADRCLCRFSSRSVVGLPLIPGEPASASTCFETCSAFTRVPACMVAEPSKTVLCHRSASVDVVSTNHSACYRPETADVGWVLHPLGKRAFPRRTDIVASSARLTPEPQAVMCPVAMRHQHEDRRIYAKTLP